MTKARILGAVREAKGDRSAEQIAHLKKGEMAEQAQVLLAGSGWLPEPLRTPGKPLATVSAPDEPAHEAGNELGVRTSLASDQLAEIETHGIAAE